MPVVSMVHNRERDSGQLWKWVKCIHVCVVIPALATHAPLPPLPSPLTVPPLCMAAIPWHTAAASSPFRSQLAGWFTPKTVLLQSSKLGSVPVHPTSPMTCCTAGSPYSPYDTAIAPVGSGFKTVCVCVCVCVC